MVNGPTVSFGNEARVESVGIQFAYGCLCFIIVCLLIAHVNQSDFKICGAIWVPFRLKDPLKENLHGVLEFLWIVNFRDSLIALDAVSLVGN
jgi:hypothetical protein